MAPTDNENINTDWEETAVRPSRPVSPIFKVAKSPEAAPASATRESMRAAAWETQRNALLKRKWDSSFAAGLLAGAVEDTELRLSALKAPFSIKLSDRDGKYFINIVMRSSPGVTIQSQEISLKGNTVESFHKIISSFLERKGVRDII